MEMATWQQASGLYMTAVAQQSMLHIQQFPPFCLEEKLLMKSAVGVSTGTTAARHGFEVQ